MSARKLALDLMQLKSRERERLLADLPPHRREELKELMREATALAKGEQLPFEDHLHAAEKSERRPGARLAALNEGQLRILLGAEPPAVQQRVVEAIRSGEVESWPPSVRRVVLAWLRAHLHASSVAAPEQPVSRSFWTSWAIWRKSA